MRDPREDPEPGDMARSKDSLGQMDIEVLAVYKHALTGRWWVRFRVRRDGRGWDPPESIPLADWRIWSTLKTGRRWRAAQGDQHGA